ncbi:uncharacterized protein CANTADRAFT_5433 [Suhomyces tanzawaensis NRRL Y-17324]|uniref:F-box domain-containing protein n=1 Tax=Suhomyces tanzawaensis NRRL Y-17324 TaxID=984487 RepID=A0A1E4SJN0_9ASCO|nr:uncharacterized protein CANTADRAFT_5433 [Suhomyces tanzawaensis NRRL Y-17324]ODV79716.1 hypothetical protein CANTADRAFT_5433 [Suhomyces tanzawaensis NRRL Y-17324]
MGTLLDLPDEVLFFIYRSLGTQTLKSLLLFQQLQRSVYCYLYENSKYVLQYDRFGHQRGLNLLQARKYQRHLRRFRHLQVNICLREGEDVKKVVGEYGELWRAHPPGRIRRHIDLLIHVHYTHSTFNSIKDAMLNIREVSECFGRNEVRVDLVLTKDE